LKVLYLETSALLAWLFNEPSAAEAVERINQSDLIVTSELLIVETCRALIRAGKENLLSKDQYRLLYDVFMSNLKSWFRMSMDLSVIERAGESFPAEPLRSLDAIHLATALEYKKLYPDLTVLSYDRRILDNLIPLGLG